METTSNLSCLVKSTTNLLLQGFKVSNQVVEVDKQLDSQHKLVSDLLVQIDSHEEKVKDLNQHKVNLLADKDKLEVDLLAFVGKQKIAFNQSKDPGEHCSSHLKQFEEVPQ